MNDRLSAYNIRLYIENDIGSAGIYQVYHYYVEYSFKSSRRQYSRGAFKIFTGIYYIISIIRAIPGERESLVLVSLSAQEPEVTKKRTTIGKHVEVHIYIYI